MIEGGTKCGISETLSFNDSSCFFTSQEVSSHAPDVHLCYWGYPFRRPYVRVWDFWGLQFYCIVIRCFLSPILDWQAMCFILLFIFICCFLMQFIYSSSSSSLFLSYLTVSLFWVYASTQAYKYILKCILICTYVCTALSDFQSSWW